MASASFPGDGLPGSAGPLHADPACPIGQYRGPWIPSTGAGDWHVEQPRDAARVREMIFFSGPAKSEFMRELHPHIPSPKALLAFEAAARHLSFTHAAEELHVTQVAVSYQVRKVEDALGVELFERQHRGIVLTPAGEWFYRAVSHGMGHIAEAAYQIRRYHGDSGITVAANNAVSFYWLRPRVTAFQRQHPDIELRVLAGDRDDIDLVGHGVDVAIRHGMGDWPGYQAAHLFEEVAFPVCAPEYARRHGPFNDPRDLLDATLLQLDPLSPDWVTWHKWFLARGVDVPEDEVPVAINFNSYPILLEAAIEAQGVALGGGFIIDPLLDDGKLTRLDDTDHRTGCSYYLVTPEDVVQGADVRAFCAWLLQSAATSV